MMEFTSIMGSYPMAFACYVVISILRFALVDKYPIKGVDGAITVSFVAVSGFLASCAVWSRMYRVRVPGEVDTAHC